MFPADYPGDVTLDASIGRASIGCIKGSEMTDPTNGWNTNERGEIIIFPVVE